MARYLVGQRGLLIVIVVAVLTILPDIVKADKSAPAQHAVASMQF